MTLKERITQEAEIHSPWPSRSEFMVDRTIVRIRQDSFKEGADFAIKTIVEMLEERQSYISKTDTVIGSTKTICDATRVVELDYIIKLLKSEK